MHRDPQREAQLGNTEPVGRHSVSVPLESTASLPLVPSQDDAARVAARTANVAVTLPVGVAMVIVAHGPNAGARFLLDRDITTAGRHPDSDIFLDDITVSRQHAQFQRGADGIFTVIDSGSLNGVYVNRQRVHTTSLQDGDEVQIGKFRMMFHAT
jgi:pSer/pThr/pTyr-binding forkhead associated (FHA) protein